MKIKKDTGELLLTMLLVIGCHTVKHLSMNLPAFDKEGHRGSRGLMPENTIPAMLKALDLGVTTLEMDAVITKDKQVILSHEPFFNHEITTKEDGSFIDEKEEKKYNIFGMTLAETRKFDVGLKPHPRFTQQTKIAANKPLLADVIDEAEKYAAEKNIAPPFYNIETKSKSSTDNIFHPAPEEFVDLLVGVIKSRKVTDRVIIQSFDIRTLQVVQKKYPEIKTALLIEDYDKRSLEEQLAALGFKPTIYSPHFVLVNDSLVQRCHQQNIKVIPWTVNDKKQIEYLKKLKIDGIITDFPDLFNE